MINDCFVFFFPPGKPRAGKKKSILRDYDATTLRIIYTHSNKIKRTSPAGYSTRKRVQRRTRERRRFEK